MEELYKLRSKFIVVGITGRSGSGCSKIANNLSNKDYFEDLEQLQDNGENDVNAIKYNICLNYFKLDGNWKKFTVIKYTNVILFHLLYECCLLESEQEAGAALISSICLKDQSDTERFNIDSSSYSELVSIANDIIGNVYSIFKDYSCNTLFDCIYEDELSFYNEYTTSLSFIEAFTRKLKDIDAAKANIFFHDKVNNLRITGKALESWKGYNKVDDNNNVFVIAKTINQIIKGYRKSNSDGARIVIDSIKNSLELTFFKERYSAFYCIATNKLPEERKSYKQRNIRHSNPELIVDQLMELDDIEYKGKDVLKGEFAAPDIENCIQKSGYHIFWSEKYNDYQHQLIGESELTTNLDIQLVKFLALLFQPGIITPTSLERNMQIAFNAKANSGCISRQVGAVITDSNHSVKSIGWNDVANNQLPCNLRSLSDLKEGENLNYFSDFEKGEGNTSNYHDGESFKDKISTHFKDLDTEKDKLKNKLKGKHCSFCFKTFHNFFEGESNQVHTRSLHAEENAMLQLTKYGGQGVKDGILYTTASPCELCSKKAFQLGIREIVYIDPYPGIATTHILKSGKNESLNPTLKMFRGAVGSTFHKLYEPAISYKDELNILTDLHPKIDNNRIVEKLTDNLSAQEEIKAVLKRYKE